MPILVACPGCGAKLNAPDSAAGKKVKCPKAGCGAVVPVPEPLPLEPEFDDPQPAPPPPQRRPARAAVEEEDDRPRKKARRDDDEDEDEFDSRRKRKSGGLSAGLIVAITLGGLLLLGGIGYGIYALTKKSDSAGSGGGGGGRGGGDGGGGGSRASVPAGWVEHKSQKDKFKAYFPKEPLVRPLPYDARSKLPIPRSEMVYMYGKPTDDLFILLNVVQLQPNATQADRDAQLTDFTKDHRGGERSVTWAGLPAKEYTSEKPGPDGTPRGSVGRQMVNGNTIYTAVILAGNGPPPPEVVNGFFDNFELLR